MVVASLNYAVFWAQHIVPPSSLSWKTQITFVYRGEFNFPGVRFQSLSYDNGLSCRENEDPGPGTLELSEAVPTDSQTWSPDCDDPGDNTVGWTSTPAVHNETYVPWYIDVFSGVTLDISDN